MTTIKPAVFLDRDGVLIHEEHYLSKLEQIQLYDDVAEGLKKLKEKGYLLIMVTNQSGVARGYFNRAFVESAYQKVNQDLSAAGVSLDKMYYCPHHPKGNGPDNIVCDCRKPEPGMILQACEEYHSKFDIKIDLKHSFMIGDKLCDIKLAEHAGVTGIQVRTGHGEEEAEKVEAAFPNTPIFERFSGAVEYILG